jgi:hypothetical protein
MKILAWTRAVLILAVFAPGLAIAQNRIFGTPVTQQSCSGSTQQRWSIQGVANGFAYKNYATGRCLDIVGKSSSVGALLQVWSCSYAWNQVF